MCAGGGEGGAGGGGIAACGAVCELADGLPLEDHTSDRCEVMIGRRQIFYIECSMEVKHGTKTGPT